MNPKQGPSPLRLLIGDGGVRIEQSHNHLEDQARATAAYVGEHNQFRPSQATLIGKPWVEESSEFELLALESVKPQCLVLISRDQLKRAPSSKKEAYIYKVKVKVVDGIKSGPLETLINGENEGEILFGEYPLNSWQSVEDLVLQETVIPSWFYEIDRNHYEITKQMGEHRYLKKTLKFDPYLKKVQRVKYEILSGHETEVDQQMAVLAKLDCSSPK